MIASSDKRNLKQNSPGRQPWNYVARMNDGTKRYIFEQSSALDRTVTGSIAFNYNGSKRQGFLLLLQQHHCACFGFLITGNWCIFLSQSAPGRRSRTLWYSSDELPPLTTHRMFQSKIERETKVVDQIVILPPLGITGKTVSTTHDSVVRCEMWVMMWATNPGKRSSSLDFSINKWVALYYYLYKNDEFYSLYWIIDVPVLTVIKIPVVSSFDYAEHRTSDCVTWLTTLACCRPNTPNSNSIFPTGAPSAS